jgi:uncharacterized protein YjbI with pentapeptide repeats
MALPLPSFISKINRALRRERLDRGSAIDNPILSERLREGVDAWNSWRLANSTAPSLTRASLRRLPLPGIDFSGADLFEADLSAADLTSAQLHGASLLGALLVGAHLEHANLELQLGGR